MSKAYFIWAASVFSLMVSVAETNAQWHRDEMKQPRRHILQAFPMVTLEVVVNGEALKPVERNGDLWLATQDLIGKEYQLRVTNNGPGRTLVVIGIDGLSILGKKPFQSKGRGYVLEAGQTALLRGWRTSQDKVEAFKFSTEEGSLAKGTKSGIKIGQIEMLAIAEMPQHFYSSPYPRMNGNRYSQGAPSTSLQFQRSMGTAAGRTINDSSTTTTFRRGFNFRRIKYRYGFVDPQESALLTNR